MSADPTDNNTVKTVVSLTDEAVKRGKEPGWKSKLLRAGRDGQYKKLLANATATLEWAPEFKGVLSYNASAHEIRIARPLPWDKPKDWIERQWQDHDSYKFAEWLQRAGIEVSDRIAGSAAITVAKENSFHPIRDYFNSLEWDGRERLDIWLPRYLATQDRPYERAIGSRWIISMVARIMKPGCKADCVLLLIGDQGQGKSTALEILASKPWFTDEIGLLNGGRDTPIAMAGKLLVEFSDLEGFDRKEAGELKSFLSRTTDRFRAVFGHFAEDHPRQTIFAGTTNQRSPLKDFTGNRRFWPVETGKVDLAALRNDRDQLWAEAVHRYNQGELWWLDTPELKALANDIAEERRDTDVLEEDIGNFLAGKERITMLELIEKLGLTSIKTSRSEQTRIGNAIHAVGWKKLTRNRTEKNPVYVPEHIPDHIKEGS